MSSKYYEVRNKCVLCIFEFIVVIGMRYLYIMIGLLLVIMYRYVGDVNNVISRVL